MSKNKNGDNKLMWILVGIVAIALIWYFVVQAPAIEDQVGSVNQGASVKAVIVDASGNVIQELAAAGLGGSKDKPLTVIAPESATGYIIVDNVATFLAFQTQLDNSAGDSEVTATGVTATNPCSAGNPLVGQSECTGITHILGIAGAGNGDLNAKWSTEIGSGLILPEGQVSSVIQSDNLVLTPIEVGLVDFRLDVSGTYLDAQGQDQPLSGVFGKTTLKIAAESCDDGTPADTTIATDEVQYCSSISVGKYCRVSALGNTHLTDNAQVCGCDTGFEPEGGTGDVCVPIIDCTTTWGADTCNPAGGILYCNADGTITNECVDCNGDGDDNIWGTADDECPLNANNDYAIGCVADTDFVCDYPAVSSSSFYVDVSEPTIDPQVECGDGVKDGTEECDGSDLGGESCVGLGYTGGTLGCTGSCTYDESGCLSANVRFRTFSLDYDAGNAVAYNPICGNTLIKYGRTSGSCTNHDCIDTDQTLNVPSTSGTTKMWYDDSTRVCVCEDMQTSGYPKRYSDTDSDKDKVSDSTLPETPANELTC